MDKHTVLVSRKWDNPNIRIAVTDTEIGISMSLEDFMAAVVKEVGNPSFLLTQNALHTKMQEAAIAIVHEMKINTAKVM